MAMTQTAEAQTTDTETFAPVAHRTASLPQTGAVTLTQSAATEVRRVMDEQGFGPETMLRVGVAGGGCSGFQYSLGFDETTDPAKDHVSEQHGVKLAVDKKSALFLDGTVVDFYNGIDQRGFKFENPNAVKSCGCGSSFSA